MNEAKVIFGCVEPKVGVPEKNKINLKWLKIAVVETLLTKRAHVLRYSSFQKQRILANIKLRSNRDFNFIHAFHRTQRLAHVLHVC